MSLRTNQMEDFLTEIQARLDETLEACRSMAHVDVAQEARQEARQELQTSAEAVANLQASIKAATKAAGKLESAMNTSVWTFRAFTAAMFIAAASILWTGYNVHEMANALPVVQDRAEQVIWNQTHPKAQRGLWDVGQFHNDWNYEQSWRSKQAAQQAAQ